MDREDRNAYKLAAKKSLAEAAYDPKKLMCIHAGVMLLLSLGVSIISYLLERGIEDTGGLAGLGTRGILMTVKTVINLLPVLLLPFWQIGYVFVSVTIARGKKVAPKDLAAGFHNFLPVLRLKLLTAALYAGLMFLTTQIGTTVFMLTPWAEPLMSAITAFSEDSQNVALEEAMNAAFLDAALPMVVIMLGLFAVFAVPFFYRFRFSEQYLMERPEKGAIAALRASAMLTRFRRIGIFKLDLSFWWYYLLSLVAAGLCYGDVLLEMLGVVLPWSADVSYFLCIVLSGAAQFALCWWRKNEVDVTYAQVYADYQNPPAEPQQTQKVQFWNS